MPLHFSEAPLVNRWLHTAYILLWIFCGLFAALLVGIALLWAITDPTLSSFPEASVALLGIAWGVFIVGILVIGGLAVPGSIAKEVNYR